MARKTRLSSVSPNSVYTKRYEKFRGVDFSKDESKVDDVHSPSGKNLISDTGGFPEKRVGWRKIHSFGNKINGIYGFEGENGSYLIVHSGTGLFKYENGESTELLSGITDKISCGKYFKGKICILTGGEYIVYDGETASKVSARDDVYAPITHISRQPMAIGIANSPSSDDTFKAWNNEGSLLDRNSKEVYMGKTPDEVMINLVSPRRRNCFEIKGSSRDAIILDSTIDAGTRVVMKCILTGKTLFDVVYDGSKYQKFCTRDNGSEGVNLDGLNIMELGANNLPVSIIIGNSEYNKAGFIICQIKQGMNDIYAYTEGVDNFSVEFSHTVEGYADRIDKCTVMDVFENRIFFSGNPDYPNTDWCSGVNDPMFIPDINYTEIGVDSTKIVGYLRTGSEQAILKEDGEDATIYMRSSTSQTDGRVIFPIRQGVSGIGAVAERSVCTVLDDPVYLSRNGVYAVATQDISKERSLNPRSTRINNRLLRENGLENAHICEWDGKLLLALNGVCYVADTSQKVYTSNFSNAFEYEWYYWTNIPARTFFECKGELFFGTESGFLCEFNSDMLNENGELKAEAYSDDGQAIVAEWSTNLSDDGDFMREKTLQKIGSGVFLRGRQTYTGISVYVRTDKEKTEQVSCASFSGKGYMAVPLNTRIKKYGAIQVICRNDKVNEPFGICGITRRFTCGHAIKK